MVYADVIVNISVEALDKSYQYRVPGEWRERAVVGAPVLIPFGKGNRAVEGYIIGLSDEPKIEPSRIKSIQEVVCKGVVVESQLLMLAHWIKVNYGATMNEAIRVVIPVKSQIRNVVKRYVVRKATLGEVEQWLADNGANKRLKARVRLLQELCKEPVIDMGLVLGKFGISRSTLKGLEDMGMIEVQSETNYRNPLANLQQKKRDIQLNAGQRRIVDEVVRQYGEGIRKTYLIHGITGSGKTEVYIEIIEQVVRAGKQVIFLIPEIALTYQTVMRFYHKFGDRVSILNSRMSAGERYDQYVRAKEGGVDIMIGPRSALFTPFNRLGLIVIDEEHEGSYKSDAPPKYHARETAVERARLAGASVILGSATPSLEAYREAVEGGSQLFTLTERAGAGTVPPVQVVDMREELANKNRSAFSGTLKTLIQDRLDKRQQIMLFLNRRGYAGFVSCRSCGTVLTCPHCDISLKSHVAGRGEGSVGKRAATGGRGRLVCHYCGYEEGAPDVCPQCGSPYIGAFGTGTQKIEEMVKREFPSARVLRMDMDTTSGKQGHEKILEAFVNHEADILVGTQMIVKGHDFPLVTLMGVLAADMSLFVNDYRASERTFQLLMQAAGRAGRGGEAGDVVVQTYRPDHYAVRAAASHDYESFYRMEIAHRKLLQYPPISDIMAVLAASEKEERSDAVMKELLHIAKAAYREGEVKVIGPAAASVAKIKDQYRRVLYVKGRHERLVAIKDDMEKWLLEDKVRSDCFVHFDFNPVHGY